MRLLTTQAAMATEDPPEVRDDLREMVTEMLGPDGHVDPVMMAEDAFDLIDDLESLVDDGRGDDVVAPLQLAMTLLRAHLKTHADEEGTLRETLDRASDLFRRVSPGGQADHAEAAARPATAGWASKQLVLGLTDPGGDLDATMSVLGPHSNPQYGALLARLDAEGRVDDALRVVDHAVAAGRVSLRYSGPFGGDRWLDPSDVGFRYLAAGRPDDALRALREAFERQPSDESYQVLLGCAIRVDAVDEQRDWAMQHARTRAEDDGHGGLLVTLLLTEGDVDGALSVAAELGAGDAWVILAQAVEETDPARAAELHRPALERTLQHADKRSYQMVAALLATMRDLYEAAGARPAFDAEIRLLRATYKRRRLMMRELNKAKLPR